MAIQESTLNTMHLCIFVTSISDADKKKLLYNRNSLILVIHMRFTLRINNKYEYN